MSQTTQTTGRIGRVFIALLSLFLFFSSGAAEAATRQWVGASGGLWSVDANWSPAIAPVAGDDVVFPAATSAVSVNDLVGPTVLQSLRFEGPHTIQGAGALRVTVSIEVLAAATIESPLLQLAAGAAISGTGAPAPTLTIASVLSALGDLSITGVLVDATNNNQFNGTMTVGADGTYRVSATGALGPNVNPTLGLHLAGGTVAVNVGNTALAVNRLTGDGTLHLGPGNPSGFFTVENTGTDLFTGDITGNMVFSKYGPGTLTLGGATTTHGMYVSAGELVVAHEQTLATTGASVFSGATLTYDVSSTTTGPINLHGTGLNSAGALRLRGGSLTVNGQTTLHATVAISVTAPHQLLLNGQFVGNDQTFSVIGGGTVVFNNSTNTASTAIVGDGTVPGPTLRAGVAGALNFTAMTINAGGTLDMGGFAAGFSSFSGTGRIETGGVGGNLALASNNATFDGTYHGPGRVNMTFIGLPVTLAGTHTLSGVFETSTPHLIVKGTMPAVVSSMGEKVTLEPGSAIGPLNFTPLSLPGQLIVGDAINPGGATTSGLHMISGSFKPMLSGTAPRLTVNGTVALMGAAIDLTYAGAIPPGILTLIANDGADPITGIFSNLPDGSEVTLNGVMYVVSYKGGDGNDLTLTPPMTTYHLSEGATGTFFDTDLLIANPWDQAIVVDVTFLPENAGTLARQYTLAPQSRRTIRVDEIDGLESAAFSTIVKPTVERPIAVERTMRWDATGYGGHTEKATAGPATTWYFAEGSEGFFRTFLLLANPQTTPNVAHVTWLREGAGAIERSYELLPTSRRTVAAVDDLELVNQAFGITVTFDQPGVAERAMYFGGPPAFKGGHESAGVTAPSTTWLLAEGATGSGFETFILVANPGSEEADVTFTFLPADGPPASIERKAAGRSRVTVNPEAEDLSIPLGPVATQVTATKPVIAERAQYWPFGPAEWTEAHNSFGVTEAAPSWLLAEGRVGGSEGYQTYILLANPGDTVAHVELRYLGDGQTQTPAARVVDVPPQQRVNVAVETLDPNAIVTFGTFITSDRPIVVERAMYWNVNGEVWAAGTNATATKMPTP
jgi:Family of unknown function (DUF5719)